ncbi:hypothetical protein [Microvirga massiliensis]|uniref:hypothetical protein n=1 Tax=Microvirga massiliensis TaxID=1033741 RepID=UPI00062B4E3D|nr:hypothetical protein [Microvirga massiliensis]
MAPQGNQPKTRHPAAAAECSFTEIALFERIAVNDTDSPIDIGYLSNLVRKGLVIHEPPNAPYVPAPVLMQWRQWHAENAELPDM